MKATIIFSFLSLGFMISAFSQWDPMEITFTAIKNQQHISIDSIVIENLTQGGDTTLYAPDTVLTINNYLVGISDQLVDDNNISISQNYPNPFHGKTEFNLYLSDKENISITVQDILGRECANFENNLPQGNHSFAFYSRNEMYYILKVKGKHAIQTIKMINTNRHSINGVNCKIEYIGKKEVLSRIDYKSQQAINGFKFYPGDYLKYSAFAENIERFVIDDPSPSNQSYRFQFASGSPCIGMPTIFDIDSNVYKTVQIGTQCWLEENLKTTTYRNGTPIPNVPDPDVWKYLTTGAYVWNNNDSIWKNIYGALYNWYAVDDPNGLCPSGWHVPSISEWHTLINFAGGSDVSYANDLKSCRDENSPLGDSCNTPYHPRWSQCGWVPEVYGTNYTGFSGLPGGARYYFYGSFMGHGTTLFLFSSTENPIGAVKAISLSCNDGTIYEYSAATKKNGYSVRCIRD